MEEYLGVTDGDENDWECHTHGGEEEGVAEVGGTVPHTTQRLPVVHVVSPPNEVRQLEEKAGDPQTHTHGQGLAGGVDTLILLQNTTQ